jgi:hypothetical protein
MAALFYSLKPLARELEWAGGRRRIQGVIGGSRMLDEATSATTDTGGGFCGLGGWLSFFLDRSQPSISRGRPKGGVDFLFFYLV